MEIRGGKSKEARRPDESPSDVLRKLKTESKQSVGVMTTEIMDMFFCACETFVDKLPRFAKVSELPKLTLFKWMLALVETECVTSA